ncbi:MAG: hypothetical protein HZA06_02200 [Nitrospirae bacterium]|nr:hypothetical protein [Nitrospirota bacterium]
MQLPTEIKITSHRPVIGRFIVAYKKLIRLLIAPYLRNAFEAVDEKLNSTSIDILNRTDALIVTLDQRLETLSVRQERLREELEKHREEILSSIGELQKRVEELGLKMGVKSKG